MQEDTSSSKMSTLRVLLTLLKLMQCCFLKYVGARPIHLRPFRASAASKSNPVIIFFSVDWYPIVLVFSQ